MRVSLNFPSTNIFFILPNTGHQILGPVLLYIDGGDVTSQIDNLQVTSLSIIGILNRKARGQELAWRNLGFVPNYTKEDVLGKRMFVELGHVWLTERYGNDNFEEDKDIFGPSDVDKEVDYLTILASLVKSLKQVTGEGMVVDIDFKGCLYKNCELVFLVPFVKCNGDAGYKLYLHYRSTGACCWR